MIRILTMAPVMLFQFDPSICQSCQVGSEHLIRSSNNNHPKSKRGDPYLLGVIKGKAPRRGCDTPQNISKNWEHNLRVVPGDIIPAHVISDEHHNVGRLARGHDAGHQEGEDGEEQHGGQGGGQLLQRLLITGLIF